MICLICNSHLFRKVCSQIPNLQSKSPNVLFISERWSNYCFKSKEPDASLHQVHQNIAQVRGASRHLIWKTTFTYFLVYEYTLLLPLHNFLLSYCNRIKVWYTPKFIDRLKSFTILKFSLRTCYSSCKFWGYFDDVVTWEQYSDCLDVTQRCVFSCNYKIKLPKDFMKHVLVLINVFHILLFLYNVGTYLCLNFVALCLRLNLPPF